MKALVAILLLSWSLAVADERVEDGQINLKRDLGPQITRLMETLQIPGVAVGIVYGDYEAVEGFGVTSIANPLPITPSTLFQIGSITKTYTTTALMRLVEEGLVDLNTPIQQYIPSFTLSNEDWAKEVTLRHLLNHTAGWEGDYLLSKPVGGRGDDALRLATDAMRDAPLLTRPGSVYHYNNTGFSVAGRLIEVLTEQHFESALERLVFEPLDLHESYLLAEEILPHRFAIGHTHKSKSEVQPAQWWAHRCLSSAGAVVSSANDLITYAQFHLGMSGSSTKILQPATIAMMQSPQFLVDDYPLAIGLGWIINEVGGVTVVSHLGSSQGQVAMLEIVPEHNFALVVLTNADTGLMLARPVASWLHEKVLRLTPLDELNALNLDPDELDQYVGSYVGDMFRIDIERGATSHLTANISSNNGIEGWDFTGFPPVEFSFYKKDVGFVDRGFFADTVQPRFLRDQSGEIAWLRYNERLHKPLK